MNARPFNVQWFVPSGRAHYVIHTRDGGLYVGPDSDDDTRGDLVAELHGGDTPGVQGRIFQITGNDVPAESKVLTVVPDAPR